MTAELQRPIRGVLFDVDGTLHSRRLLCVVMACEMALASLSAMGKGRRNDVRMVSAFRREREPLQSNDRIEESLATRQYTAVSNRMACPSAEMEHAVAERIHRRPQQPERLYRHVASPLWRLG